MLNESETLATCIRKAQTAWNASVCAGKWWLPITAAPTDPSRSPRISVPVWSPSPNAVMARRCKRIAAARGRYILMGDADDSYDFTQVGVFVDKLREGHDLVMGNRFQGGILPGSYAAAAPLSGESRTDSPGAIVFRLPGE